VVLLKRPPRPARPPARPPQGQAAKYAFKCHRLNEGGRDVVHPVNAIAFHPQLGTFATGGGDDVVNTWDGQNKKRLFQISRWAGC
jgi:cell cycle arrest protein BUB3